MNSGMSGRKSTKVDEGWRAKDKATVQKATRIDEGWRVETPLNGRKATEVDEGWRNKGSDDKRRATVVDAGWRKDAADMLDPANIKNKATANHFATLEEFQNAVAKLSQLTSSTNNIYPVKKTISTEGGESIVLLCSDPEGNDVVAKVYYEPVNGAGSSISTRTRVLEYMGTEEGQRYTLAVLEIGLVEFGSSKYYFEITPYVAGGDVSNAGAFSFDEICALTKQLNEAIHSIHEFGILHRDIKPHNIYKLNDNVALGDFGVAKLVEKGKVSATSTVRGTDTYISPELRLGLTDSPTFIYDYKVDYYALGVTLGYLFEGHSVYENMDESMILTSVRNGKLPLRRVDPKREQLENLLNGLCKYDPKYRFGYEDVNCWLVDHNYTGGIAEEEWPKAFRMLDEEYRDERSMFLGISKDEAHWNKGKEMLYDKTFEEFFRSFRTDLSSEAKLLDEQYHQDDRDKGLAMFLKKLFTPGHIAWKGYSFGGLQELGNKMVVAKKPEAFSEILQRHCISHWLAYTEGINVDEDTKKLVDEIEAFSISEPEIACYWFGNSFAEERQLNICDKTVSTIPQLIESLFSSPFAFYQGDGLKKMVDRKEGADFYGFLYSLGYREIADAEWEYMEQCDMFNKTVVLISMMDNIAVKADVDTGLIRDFFVKYGPIGIATYTKKLITEGENVYIPLDADGKQAIAQIADFSEPTTGKVDELYREYTPLVERVDKLTRILIDNPFCIITGAYENKGVVCANLMGCFGFNIFERLAPIGFSAFLDMGERGVNDDFQ